MKLFKSILTALMSAVVIAVVLIAICAAACICIASVWFVCAMLEVPFYIPLAVIACISVAMGFILEAVGNAKK